MRTRLDYQVNCPACHANVGRPCHGKEGQRLNGVHFERRRGFHAATIVALKLLYAPLPTHPSNRER